MNKYIFITHSSHDSATATEIRDYLETNGIKCWMAPRDIPVGEEWAEAILDGIENASGMLLVFSSNSNDSSQVRREIERAIHNDLPVFPVRIENVVPSKAMEYYISSNHWMDAFGGNFETNLSKLVTAIKNKHNITQENESDPISKPVQMKEHSSASSSKINNETSKRKFKLPKFSFKIPKKILFPIVFILLLLAGYFISKSFENSSLDTTTAEVIAPLPTDTISSFVRMIASTDEFGDYVSGIKVTEDGNYVIMGYSYVNDFEGRPWIAMFDSLGNEMWKHEGSILGGEGEFDIYPDGRCVWAYSLVDTSLVNAEGFSPFSPNADATTREVQELLSTTGEPISGTGFVFIPNSNRYYGRETNTYSKNYGSIRDVYLTDNRIYIETISQFHFTHSISQQDSNIKFVLSNEENCNQGGGIFYPLFETHIIVLEDSGENLEYVKSKMIPCTGFGSSNMEILDEILYCASVTSTSMQLHSWVSFAGDSTELSLAEEFSTHTYNVIIVQEPPFREASLSFSKIYLMMNSHQEFVLASLFPDGNIYCLKVDKDGNEVWLKSFSTTSNSDEIFGATFIHNSYFLYGQTYTLETGNYDGYLLKLDEEGNVCWERTYDFGNSESLWGVEGTADGGLVLVLQSEVNGTSDVFLLKADSLGCIPEFDTCDNVLLYEDWFSVETIENNWLERESIYWNIERMPEYDNNICLTIRDLLGIYKTQFSTNSNSSLTFQLGVSGYVNIDSKQNYLRVGVLLDGQSLAQPCIEWVDNSLFPVAVDWRTGVDDSTRISRRVPFLEKVWFHWDYDSNESFESCGRIGVGYFNGDSIVVGRVEPDTAWVEYSVLNDFEIKIDGNSADYFINDSLFFHTDEFVCESESLYLYLGGASNTIPNAIGEVRVTSE
ncbi:MAG: toll/interleukin-1 receptor domain-containing protein [Candidatus Sabulitectum sp.]|nr:toll/interleukin-1 receptor domain-containing protein [Candidatus Sabulitectum sp.]